MEHRAPRKALVDEALTKRSFDTCRTREGESKWPKLVAAICILFLCVLFPFSNAGLAESGEESLLGLQGIAATPYISEQKSKIITTLELMSKNDRLVESAKGKLLTMDEKHTRLLSALCERITADGESPGSGIAFLLATVLIILS